MKVIETDLNPINISHIYGNSAKQEINDRKETLMNFLKSKDDNLLLLMSGLLYSVITNDSLDPVVLHEC